MKIAQIAPLIESVPPRGYGGTERVVSHLTEELVRQGHEVTLFASGDSVTAARLVACAPRSLRNDPLANDPLPYNVYQIEQVRQRAEAFDILHFHTDYVQFPIFRKQRPVTLTTLHGRLDLPDLRLLFEEFRDMPLVSISHSQRRPLSGVNWAGNVYHGLPGDLLTPTDQPSGDYLAFLGRICPEKRPDRAIEIACRAGLPLRIAAKVDRVDQDYFDTCILPLLARPGIEFIGEIGESDKSAFLGNALALLFPIDWPEPFGLTMIEAMAGGTPTIAWPCGSVPEIIEEGLCGFMVRDMDTAVEAVGRVKELDRKAIRQRFETRFSSTRMAADYLALYESMTEPPEFWLPDPSRQPLKAALRRESAHGPRG